MSGSAGGLWVNLKKLNNRTSKKMLEITMVEMLGSSSVKS